MSEQTAPMLLVPFGPDGVGKSTLLDSLLRQSDITQLGVRRFPGRLLPTVGDAHEAPWMDAHQLREAGLWDEFVGESVATWGAAMRTCLREERERGEQGARLVVVDSSPFHKTLAAAIGRLLEQDPQPNVAPLYEHYQRLLGDVSVDTMLQVHVGLWQPEAAAGATLQRRLASPGTRSSFDPTTAEASGRQHTAYMWAAGYLASRPGSRLLRLYANEPLTPEGRSPLTDKAAAFIRNHVRPAER